MNLLWICLISHIQVICFCGPKKTLIEFAYPMYFIVLLKKYIFKLWQCVQNNTMSFFKKIMQQWFQRNYVTHRSGSFNDGRWLIGFVKKTMKPKSIIYRSAKLERKLISNVFVGEFDSIFFFQVMPI